MRPKFLKTGQRQFTESAARIYKTTFCLWPKTLFFAAAGILHLSEEELPSERLRGIFRYLERMRLKDGGQEEIPRDLTHGQLPFPESWGTKNISTRDFSVLLLCVCVADSTSTIRKDLLLLISCTSAALSEAASLWLQIRIRLPLSALGQSRANSSKLRLSQQGEQRAAPSATGLWVSLLTGTFNRAEV